MQINIRLILVLLGYFVIFVGILMFIPALVDYIFQEKEVSAATPFLICGVITLFTGISLLFANKNEQNFKISVKEGMLLTVLTWVSAVGLAALPFKYSYLNIPYTDAFFEMMSGITTTGSTVIPDLQQLSYGMHLWRAIFQWIGGIGIVVTGIILIPSMQVSGMQMFKIESFETFDSAFAKAKSIALGMLIIYTAITIIIIFLLLYLAHLSFFDSLIHSLTSVSTAGFSNKNESLAYFNNPKAEFIIILAMVSGGIPYILYYYFFFIHKNVIFPDAQVRAYFKLIIIITIILMSWLILENGINFFTSFRYSLFSVVSLMTGTGYVTVNYEALGIFPTVLLFCTMFIGGCGGSTACGIKVYRFQVGMVAAKIAMQKMFLKKHVFLPIYNKKVIKEDFIMVVFAFFFLFIITLTVGTVLISMFGNIDFTTALSAVVACLTNVGPGLGMVGPANNFALLAPEVKWILSILMLVGRLEILGVFLLFTRTFWIR